MTVFDLAAALSPPCADTPELFYNEHPAAVAYAKAICRACPLRSPCLTEALMTEQQFGIWGGKTPEERQRRPT